MNTVATPMYEWKAICWRKVERSVFKLQKRIYQASQRDDEKTVHKLQKLLVKSWSAKCLAIRKVSQDNRGKKTAGVDGLKSLTPKQRLALAKELNLTIKPKPVRRIWIPKPGKAEKRPLGIPIIKDRALQALAKLALEPAWEAKFEPNSYGFRPGRCAQDAQRQILMAITRKAKYVLDADICKCFDRIDHTALLAKLNTTRIIKQSVKGWLKVGAVEGQTLYPSEQGTPQGGVISPLLMNIALHGLETKVVKAFPKFLWQESWPYRWQPQIIRYADDLVILHHDLPSLQKAKQIAADFLAQIGLEFKEEKTRITHTLDKTDGTAGFDFLGFNVRQYPCQAKHGFKALIKPSKQAISRHCAKMAQILRSNKHADQEQLIGKLNPIIRGWANYFQTAVSSKIFAKLDYLLNANLMRWATRKHPKTNRHKIYAQYWRNHRFRTASGLKLEKHTDHHIKSYTKVKGSASPFNGDLMYWASRLGKSPLLDSWKARLLKQQQGICTWCGLYFQHGDILETDHIVPIGQGGSRKRLNLQLLHAHCHDSKTALQMGCL